MLASYRDPGYAASLRIEKLRERSQDLSEGVPSEITRIHARRVARTWAGAVGMLGFALVVVTTLGKIGGPLELLQIVPPTVALAVTGPAAIAVYVVVRWVTARSFPREVRSGFTGEHDPMSRLALLENDSVRSAAAKAAAASERRSIASPMIAASLVLPLTIHMVAGMVLKGPRSMMNLERVIRDFDWWIAATFILVGLAHGVLAVLCARFASRVADAPLASLAEKSPQSGWGALGWTVLASLVPGLVAIAIPPILVAVTGAMFVPHMFKYMHRRAVEERRALDVG
ncbi:MAG: hypothetical protein R3F14_22075 [Polyangiaceae bacterium]